jgi:hypothetical protein
MKKTQSQSRKRTVKPQDNDTKLVNRARAFKIAAAGAVSVATAISLLVAAYRSLKAEPVPTQASVNPPVTIVPSPIVLKSLTVIAVPLPRLTSVINPTLTLPIDADQPKTAASANSPRQARVTPEPTPVAEVYLAPTQIAVNTPTATLDAFVQVPSQTPTFVANPQTQVTVDPIGRVLTTLEPVSTAIPVLSATPKPFVTPTLPIEKSTRARCILEARSSAAAFQEASFRSVLSYQVPLGWQLLGTAYTAQSDGVWFRTNFVGQAVWIHESNVIAMPECLTALPVYGG